MKNIEIYNTLNIDKDSSSIVATFTQEDDAVMEFKLFKDGQEIVLKDQTISLGAERKDGAVIEQDDGFLIKENNVLNITLKKNIIQVVGVVKIQLYLKDKNGEMASNTFNIRVNKKLLGAENVEATNDIKSLNTLVLELKNNTNKLIDDTKTKADKLLSGLQETGDNLSDTVKAKTDKVIEDTKKDYDSLKKTIIDENISIKLQEDIKTLQNGLKTNQNLSYEGYSIKANDTLDSRTEGMRIGGMTLLNLVKMSKGVKERVWFRNDRFSFNPVGVQTLTVLNLTSKILRVQTSKLNNEYSRGFAINANGTKVITLNSDEKLRDVLGMKENGWIIDDEKQFNEFKKGCIILLGDYSNISNISYFEDIKSFGEAEQEGDKYKISILSHGKNFVDYTMFKASSETKIEINSDNIVLEGNRAYANMWVGLSKLNLIEGRTYYAKLDIEYVSGSNEGYYEIWINGVKTGKKDFVYNKGDEVTLYIFANGNNFPSKNIIRNVIVSEKSEDNYEHYKCDKKDILIKEPLRGFEGIEDIIQENNGKVEIIRNIFIATLNGQEDIFVNNATPNQNNTIVFAIKNICKPSSPLICDKFPYLPTSLFNNRDMESITTGSSDMYSLMIRINKNKLETQDVNGFRKWLQSNNIITYCIINTPTKEIVESINLDLDTFQDKTYFNILNSMPGSLDFKIPSNLASIVQSHTKDIKILYDLIDRLIIPNLIENKSDLALLSLK